MKNTNSMSVSGIVELTLEAFLRIVQHYLGASGIQE